MTDDCYHTVFWSQRNRNVSRENLLRITQRDMLLSLPFHKDMEYKILQVYDKFKSLRPSCYLLPGIFLPGRKNSTAWIFYQLISLLLAAKTLKAFTVKLRPCVSPPLNKYPHGWSIGHQEMNEVHLVWQAQKMFRISFTAEIRVESIHIHWTFSGWRLSMASWI